MAYKKGAALINRTAPFLLVSTPLTYLVAWLGLPAGFALYGRRSYGRDILKAIDRGKPVILISNHCLPLDPLLLATSIQPRITYFTMLEETALAPGLGTFVRLLGAIPVPRDPNRLPLLNDATKLALDTRKMLHFYAEGECFLRNQEIRPFKAGAFWYAIKYGVTVLPVVTVLKTRKPGRMRAATGRAPGIRAELHFLPPMEPPPAAFRAAADFHTASEFAECVRSAMQSCIDESGGDKNLYIGPMPRIKGVNDKPVRWGGETGGQEDRNVFGE